MHVMQESPPRRGLHALWRTALDPGGLNLFPTNVSIAEDVVFPGEKHGILERKERANQTRGMRERAGFSPLFAFDLDEEQPGGDR